MKPCLIEDCPNPAGVPGTGRGMCRAHYLRWYKYGRTELVKAPQGSGTIRKGYRMIMRDGKQVREHRWLMEQALGRPLARSEHVHHIDGNKLNNSLDNLQILTPEAHTKAHATFRSAAHKECSVCHVVKPRSDFRKEPIVSRTTVHWDPHLNRCRKCEQAQRPAYEARRVRPPEPRIERHVGHFTDAEITEIVHAYHTRQGTVSALLQRFRVSKSQLYRFLRGER